MGLQDLRSHLTVMPQVPFPLPLAFPIRPPPHFPFSPFSLSVCRLTFSSLFAHLTLGPCALLWLCEGQSRSLPQVRTPVSLFVFSVTPTRCCSYPCRCWLTVASPTSRSGPLSRRATCATSSPPWAAASTAPSPKAVRPTTYLLPLPALPLFSLPFSY
jgi:hypothetical protein